jgi:methylenetetrahydrofolate reductase (NADPH)
MYPLNGNERKIIFLQPEQMTETATNTFRNTLLNPEKFTITYELVPGRGSSGKRLDKILRFAESAKIDGRIKALSITDNPGGHPALSPTSLGLEIQAMGIEPLLHFSLKDKNRNLVESQLFECHRHKLLNLLVLGGDYPRYGFQGQAMPVFDLDSVQVLNLIGQLRSGFSVKEGAPGQQMPLPSMDFFAGCVVSPFKTLEAEQVWQYVKLLTKIEHGAQFVISQLGFDMKKYQELLSFLRDRHIKIPALANIFIPTLTVARIMNKGIVPGVIFPDALLARMEEEAKSSDKGEEARLLRGARMVAAIRKIGYTGVHLGGSNLSFEAISFLLDQSKGYKEDTLQEEIHFPEKNSWYFPENCVKSDSTRKVHFFFLCNDLVHKQFFKAEGLFFSITKAISLYCAKKQKLRQLYTLFEHISKKMFFRCRMCGDCTLPEANYLCPQSGCPKRMINGPCGGSINGYCEVYPKERLCFWVRSFHRGSEPNCQHLHKSTLLPPKDWSLNRSSSWLNYFSGKDHCHLKNKD